MTSKPNAIIAGCGPGAPELITPQVRRAALNAEVLAGTERLLDCFPEYRGLVVPYDQGLEPFLGQLAPHLSQKRVVVLVTGDPGIASLATTLSKRFPDIPFKRMAGLSSIQLAFAACGLDWMDARIIRAHGSLPDWDPSWETHPGPFAILAGHAEAQHLALKLCEKTGRKTLYLCERLSLSDECVKVLTPEGFRETTIDPLSVIIIGA